MSSPYYGIVVWLGVVDLCPAPGGVKYKPRERRPCPAEQLRDRAGADAVAGQDETAHLWVLLSGGGYLTPVAIPGLTF